MRRKITLHKISHFVVALACLATAIAVLIAGAALDQLVNADYSYTVKPGDSLTKIASKQGVTVESLIAANKGTYPCLATNAACLQSRWVLTIPSSNGQATTGAGGGTYVVQKGDSLAKIAQRNNVTVQALVDANKAAYPCLSTNAACLQPGWMLTVAAMSAPTPTTGPTISTGYWDYRQVVANEINRVRVENGLQRYAWMDKLAEVAQTRSVDMTTRLYFGHGDPVTGEALVDRLMASIGYRYYYCEILHGVQAPQFSSGEVGTDSVNGWLNSPDHRACMMSKLYTSYGVGVALGSNGWWKVTAVMLKK